ncbi:MAG: hypothetical protein AAFO74_02390 [Pseudomonadota bacterium]
MAIVFVVTGLHAAALAYLLAHVSEYQKLPAPFAVEIELAELEPTPKPKPKPEPAPEPERRSSDTESAPRPIVIDAPTADVDVTSLATPAPTDPLPPPRPPDPDPGPQALSETEPPDVLTQLERDILLGVQTSGGQQANGGEREVSAAQIANALQQAECLNLKRRDQGVCPPDDPFEIALAIQERGIPPERLAPDPRHLSLSVSDKIFQREAANRFHWPDADMFEDPMAPGAYNARRIRNGQEPLWSQEMRDGFRKEE